MKYGKQQSTDAECIVNNCDVVELARIFEEYGDLPEARRVAQAIVEFRKDMLICTSTQLVEALSVVFPSRMPHGKRMRRLGQVFMALREAVNDGKSGLRFGLDRAIRYLKNDGGRLAVLTFAGHENVIVRTVAGEYRKPGANNPDWILKRITKGALKPTKRETELNPAAHSAMLRVYEKRQTGAKEEV